MGLMLGACSKKSFSSAPGSVYQQCLELRPEVKCIVECNESGLCVNNYDYTIDTDAQIKDILFVIDNSGSMSEEQAQMGSMFPNFLNILSNVDYRIAVTTTDIESSSNPSDIVNGYGAFQNGNLVDFTNGASYLDGSLPLLTEQNYFEDAISWEQTLTCERNNYVNAHCPSGDERGILAAALTMEKNPDNFIRPTGHMAVVILSDEDEGSNGDILSSEAYREDPQNFVDYFKSLYPHKSISAHSVIVQPNTSAGRDCFIDQDRAGHPPGRYGNVYAELTSLTNGELGDICANDANYSTQLQAMGDSVSQFREVLPCTPIDGEVTVTFIPDPGFNVEIIKNLAQNEVYSPTPLPANTQARIQLKCENQ